jgi:hypothetical protein
MCKGRDFLSTKLHNGRGKDFKTILLPMRRKATSSPSGGYGILLNHQRRKGKAKGGEGHLSEGCPVQEVSGELNLVVPSGNDMTPWSGGGGGFSRQAARHYGSPPRYGAM